MASIDELREYADSLPPAAPDRDRRLSSGVWASEYEDYGRMSDETRRDVRHHVDLRYGEHPQQIIDVYLPHEDVTDAPVFLFFHGGAMQEGHPRRYGFLARPFVERGAIFVSAGYRLLPDELVARREEAEERVGEFLHNLQGEVAEDITDIRTEVAEATIAGTLDARDAVAWVFRHIAQFGGDPAKITIGGHSSGAMLSLATAASDDWQAAAGIPEDTVKGLVTIGGRYGLWLANALVAGRDTRDPSREWELRRAPASVVVFGEEEYDDIGLEDSPRIHDCAIIGRGLVSELRALGGKVHEVALSPRGHWQTLRSLGEETEPTLPAVFDVMGIAK